MRAMRWTPRWTSDWIDSETITEENVAERLWAHWTASSSPAALASRGIEGMILAAKYARENNVPYFGICLGMQIAVIEYARHVAGHRGREFRRVRPELCEHKVIDFMPGQSDEIDKGGTLRLGAYPCVIQPGHDHGAVLRHAGRSHERHRHRYEFNNDYREALQPRGTDLQRHCPPTGGWWRRWS